MEIENVRIPPYPCSLSSLVSLLYLLYFASLTNPKPRYAEVLGHHERAESSQGTEIFNEIDLFEPTDHMPHFDMMDTL